MSTNSYNVTIDPFAEKHYLKKFKSKYKKSFEIPWKAFMLMLQKFDLMLLRGDTHHITGLNNSVVIYKTGFKISPQESVKRSGNRCIVARIDKQIKILLVYHKNDITLKNETKWWKNMIRNQYDEYVDIL